MTPYHYGFPIDSIPPVDPLYHDIPRQKQVYQSIVSFINWLANCSGPEIVPALTSIVSNRNYPYLQHYNAAVHAPKYLIITNEYGISFHSKFSSKIQAFNHLTHHHNKEAYTEVTEPSPS